MTSRPRPTKVSANATIPSWTAWTGARSAAAMSMPWVGDDVVGEGLMIRETILIARRERGDQVRGLSEMMKVRCRQQQTQVARPAELVQLDHAGGESRPGRQIFLLEARNPGVESGEGGRRILRHP